MRSGTSTPPAVAGREDLERLTGSEGFAWSVLDSLPGAAVLVVDRAMRIVAVGGAALAERGYDRSLMLGRELHEVLSATDYERSAALYASALAGETRVNETGALEDGRIYLTEFSPIRDHAGQVAAALAVARDVTESRRAQAGLVQANELFETSFARAPTGVALVDMDGHFLRVNAALCQMLGRPEQEILGSTSAPFTHPEDRQLSSSAFEHLRGDGSMVTVEKRYLRPDGEVVWARTHGQTVRDRSGKPTHVLSHFSDVTAVKLAEERQEQASTLFETAFADAPIGMALVAPDGRWLKVNRSLCELVGHPESRLLELTFRDITHPQDFESDLEQVQQLLAGEADRYSMEHRYLTAKGYQVWVNLSVSIVRDQDEQPLHFICHIEDISARKDLQLKLRRLADQDPLTELCNRRRFEEELDRQLARCRRYNDQAALLMIDLDGFKQVNDTYGHNAGDEMLTAVASTLKASIRDSDVIARIGGDEFAVILGNVPPEIIGAMAEKLRKVVLETRITIAGEDVAVDASVGAHALDGLSSSREAAMAKADAAMYRVKAAHR